MEGTELEIAARQDLATRFASKALGPAFCRGKEQGRMVTSPPSGCSSAGYNTSKEVDVTPASISGGFDSSQESIAGISKLFKPWQV